MAFDDNHLIMLNLSIVKKASMMDIKMFIIFNSMIAQFRENLVPFVGVFWS